MDILLDNDGTTLLADVTVRSQAPSAFIPTKSVLNTLQIGTRDLAKAACCNLSESFETTPTVDVSYSDAAMGVRQIQLLGLSGSYAQLLMENIPESRGLSGSYGLTFIPGPGVSGIQVTKGTGSVVNGYESMSGQINVEEVKPPDMDRLYINAYVGGLGRLESSVNLMRKLSERWSTALLLHGNGLVGKNDLNRDGYLDIPLGSQLNLVNRWQYMGEKGLRVQLAVKWLTDRRIGGERGFNPDTDKLTTNRYGVGVSVNQSVLSGKIGYVFPGKPYKSIGLMMSAMRFDNESYCGLMSYRGNQRSFYANLIYQTILGSTLHVFKTGLSFMNEQYDENLNRANYARRETVPGVFAEYTTTAIPALTLIAGIRGDHHNRFGFFATPRLHLKYDVSSKTVLRFSAGSGFRMANVFAENAGALVSSRSIQLPVQQGETYGYGLQPERALNFGIGFVQRFRLNDRTATFSLDAYRTVFRSQTVADYDFHPQLLLLYNLEGRSFSNSVQAEINAEPLPKLNVRLAYRWLDVRTTFSGRLLERPLLARHRAFVNLAYELNNRWLFDLTWQWLGRKRLPDTRHNPPDYRFGDYSPAYMLLNAQVTRRFGPRWEVYVGAENIGNFMQQRLFISPDQPFGPYFDGSIVWGPVNGRNIYAGLRFKLAGRE
jgi:outer membrane receptor protein involved in Fe transport